MTTLGFGLSDINVQKKKYIYDNTGLGWSSENRLSS